MQFDSGQEVIDVDGQLVEADALRIAEKIAEYDPNLYVLCIDPAQADFVEAPFVICETQADGKLHRIFEVWQLDETVLQRIEAADKTRHDVQATVDKLMADAKKERYDRYEERRLENLDIGTSVIKTKKSKYSFKKEDGTKVTVYPDKPYEVS